jgi:hypothetical protein
MNNKLLFIIFALMLTSCSHKQLYQAGQNYKKSECIRQAGSDQQYNDCLDAEKKSFETYEKERKTLKK